MESIITTDKSKFLKAEHKWFPVFKTYKEFLKHMEEDIEQCNTCKIFYWEGCNKRCKCNDKPSKNKD